jgi:hypothetical protein
MLFASSASANGQLPPGIVVDVPAPATTDPAPATTDPAPATTDPAPVTTDPTPATTDPAPASTDPAPASTDPAPATTDPKEVLSGIVADLESLATEIVAANEASPPTTTEKCTWKKQNK